MSHILPTSTLGTHAQLYPLLYNNCYSVVVVLLRKFFESLSIGHIHYNQQIQRAAAGMSYMIVNS